MRSQGLSGESLVLTRWLTSVPLVNAWVHLRSEVSSEGRVTELNRLSENVVFIESSWTIGLLIMYECVLGLQTERQCFFPLVSEVGSQVVVLNKIMFSVFLIFVPLTKYLPEQFNVILTFDLVTCKRVVA